MTGMNRTAAREKSLAAFSLPSNETSGIHSGDRQQYSGERPQPEQRRNKTQGVKPGKEKNDDRQFQAWQEAS